MSDSNDEVNIVRNAIATQLASHPHWLTAPHPIELAVWLNQLLDEGNSEVVEEPEVFLEEWREELSYATEDGDLRGMSGYAAFDVSVVSAPKIDGDMLVFYVQRYQDLLPLKASISIKPPYLPALYEGLPQRSA
jgi:hypothetical protein